jgi:hypothetical protein
MRPVVGERLYYTEPRSIRAPPRKDVNSLNALKHAGKSHRFVTFPDADHSFSAEKNRATMLREIEGFLAGHLAARPTQ